MLVGQVWADLDSRMCNRHVKIVMRGDDPKVKPQRPGKVQVASCSPDGLKQYGPLRWISVRRMHSNSTGFLLHKKVTQHACEGYRRYGGAFTLGPVRWEPCTEPAVVKLRLTQDGKAKVCYACKVCWDECKSTPGITIFVAEPIT